MWSTFLQHVGISNDAKLLWHARVGMPKRPRLNQSGMPRESVWDHDLVTCWFGDALRRQIWGCAIGYDIRCHQLAPLLVAAGARP